jgi:hypothetical protein
LFLWRRFFGGADHFYAQIVFVAQVVWVAQIVFVTQVVWVAYILWVAQRFSAALKAGNRRL